MKLHIETLSDKFEILTSENEQMKQWNRDQQN